MDAVVVRTRYSFFLFFYTKSTVFLDHLAILTDEHMFQRILEQCVGQMLAVRATSDDWSARMTGFKATTVNETGVCAMHTFERCR